MIAMRPVAGSDASSAAHSRRGGTGERADEDEVAGAVVDGPTGGLDPEGAEGPGHQHGAVGRQAHVPVGRLVGEGPNPGAEQGVAPPRQPTLAAAVTARRTWSPSSLAVRVEVQEATEELRQLAGHGLQHTPERGLVGRRGDVAGLDRAAGDEPQRAAGWAVRGARSRR